MNSTNALKALAVLVLVYIMAVGSQQELLYTIAYTMAVLLIVALAWALLNKRGIEFIRDTRTYSTQVGRTAEERFTVRNRSWLPKLWIEVRDFSTLPHHAASRVVSMGGKQTRSWVVKTPCPRRGKFTLGPVTITTGDPFGLFRNRLTVADTRSLLVYPATVDLPGLDIPVGELPGGVTMRHRTHYTTTNASGIREYVAGDAFNRIHWPTTARTGRLMVKEFELDPTSDVWIMLDLQKRAHVGSGDDSTEEVAVSISASLAKHFLDVNRAVGLIAQGQDRNPPLVLPSDRGNRQLLKVLEELVLVHAESRMTLEELLVAEGSRFGRNTTVIAVTPSLDEGWIVALRTLASHGVRAVAVLLEASTFGRAESSIFTVGNLAAAGIPTYLVKHGEPLDKALAGRGTELAGRGMMR